MLVGPAGAISSGRAAKRTMRGGGSPRAAAARASATRAWRSKASASSGTLSETSASATTEMARAGRRIVGPGQRRGHAGDDQRAQERLQRQLPRRKIGQRPADHDEQRRRHQQQEQPGRPLEREPGARSERRHVVHRR